MNEPLTGIWSQDGSTYLTDLRHPVMRKEWSDWQLAHGRRPDSTMPLEERRQFDRLMLVKYGDLCPPPARTPWQLKVYEILDQKEMLEQRRAAVPVTKQERVYIDEEF